MLFMGGLVVAVHGWFVCAFVGAVIHVVRDNVWHKLLSPCDTREEHCPHLHGVLQRLHERWMYVKYTK